MTYYMSQDLFNAGVLAMALGQHVAEIDPASARQIQDKALRVYLDFYREDNFLPELEDCATRTLAWIRNIEPDPQTQIAWLAALNKAAQRYQPNGKRKPWRLFNGLRYSSVRQPVPDRHIQYFKDLALYYLNIQTGKIPT
jgi:hypothetical protein